MHSPTTHPGDSAGGTTSGVPATSLDRAGRGGDWLAGRPWGRGDLVTATVVGLVVTALAFVYRTEIVPTDPWHYVHAAMNFPTTLWVPLGYTRYGMILPVGPLILLFGNSQVSYYFWPLLSAGVMAASVYLLGRRWWGRVAGALAVVLLVSNTVVFVNLSRGYPDVMSMALLCLALVFALAARDRLVAGDRFPLVLLLLVGFCLGWGFETRETSLLAWPVMALVLWRRGTVLRTAAAVLAPMLAWAAVDIGIGAIAYHDPLLKIHTFTGQDLATGTNPADAAAKAEFVNQSRLSYLSVIPKVAAQTVGGVWMNVLGALAVLGLLVRNRPVRLMAIWLVSVYVLFVGIGGMFSPGHPAARLDIGRYWIQFVPAIALAVAGIVAIVARLVVRVVSRPRGRTAARPVRRAVVAVLAALVAVGPVVSVAQFAGSQPAFAPNGGDALQAARSWFASQPVSGHTVWTDWETARLLPIYQRGPFGGSDLWTAKMGLLASGTAGIGHPRAGDYVVLYSAHDQTCTFCRSALAPWSAQHKTVPRTWKMQFATPTKNLQIYRVT